MRSVKFQSLWMVTCGFWTFTNYRRLPSFEFMDTAVLPSGLEAQPLCFHQVVVLVDCSAQRKLVWSSEKCLFLTPLTLLVPSVYFLLYFLFYVSELVLEHRAVTSILYVADTCSRHFSHMSRAGNHVLCHEMRMLWGKRLCVQSWLTCSGLLNQARCSWQHNAPPRLGSLPGVGWRVEAPCFTMDEVPVQSTGRHCFCTVSWVWTSNIRKWCHSAECLWFRFKAIGTNVCLVSGTGESGNRHWTWGPPLLRSLEEKAWGQKESLGLGGSSGVFLYSPF